MATFPQAAVPVFPAGYGPFASDAQALTGNTLGFTATMPVFRGIQQLPGGQATTGGTFAPLALGGTAGDILEDTYSGWSHTATSKQPANSYLVPYTGWYEVTVTVTCLAQAMWLSAGVQVSGGTIEYLGNVNTPAGLAGGCSASLIIPATGGIDYIQAGPLTSANATTDTIAAGRYPALEIAYVSSG